jgi:segregation and condensation protein A
VDENQDLGGTADGADRLQLDIDGWEGPLDLLLTLARSQKVDLATISILALVEQYLAFIARCAAAAARDRRGLSRDGGVARLPQILPAAAQGSGGRAEPDELALRLQLRLQRLDAMREAGGAADGARPGRARRVPAAGAEGLPAGAQGALGGGAFTT